MDKSDDARSVVEQLTAYVKEHPEARSYHQIAERISSLADAKDHHWVVMNAMRATRTNEHDAAAIIDAQTARAHAKAAETRRLEYDMIHANIY